MKKQIILLFAIFSFASALQAQQTTDNKTLVFPRNEIRINLLSGVLGLPEIDYEYLLEDNFGLGIAAMVGLDKKQYNINYALLPYGRLYFGSEPCEGFYIEGNTGVLSQEVNVYYYYNYGTYVNAGSEIKDEIGFGLGVALGYKFLTKNSWVGDVFLGAGRIFGTNGDVAYPRMGISIGKRF